MIVNESPAAAYPPRQATVPPAPVVDAGADAGTGTGTGPAATGSARGLGLLANDTAAIVLAQQTAPPRSAPAYAVSNLRGRDLREVDLTGMDLRGADLSGSNLTGKDLTGLDLRGATLNDARLDGADLTDVDLGGVVAIGASFDKANLLGTGMDQADFTGASFKGAYLGGVPRDNGFNAQQVAQMGKTFDIESSSFARADFTGATFMYGSFHNADLDGASFERAIFFEFGIGRQSTARDASFDGISGHLTIGGSDLTDASFRNINRSGTEGTLVAIGQSNVDGLSFGGSHLMLRLSDLDLRNVDMNVRNKDLRLSVFSNTIMTGKDFRGFDFSGSSFVNTGGPIVNDFMDPADKDMANALSGTDFRAARFDNAAFHRFDLRAALTDAGALDGATVLPDQARDQWLSDMLAGLDARRQESMRAA